MVIRLKDFAPPREIFDIFKYKPYSFLLESSLLSGGLGRFSFIGSEPFLILKSKKNDIEIISDKVTQCLKGNPFEKLRELLNIYRTKKEDTRLPKQSGGQAHLPFLGGAVGYLGYDLKYFIERLPDISTEDINIPDMFFMFYSSVIVFDHLRKEISLSTNGFPENKRFREKKEKEDMARLRGCLAAYGRKKAQANPVRELSSLFSPSRNFGMAFSNGVKQAQNKSCYMTSNFKREDYISAINKAKEYIKNGDIYQVNLSQRLSCRIKQEPFAVYERLSGINPSCFSSFFNFGDFHIVSASPERFLKLEKDLVRTRPMKGTRPRGATRREDVCLRGDLLRSNKDKAELLMIVDLERNDLGRVCKYGSINVKSIRNLEAYATVFQTTADVTGRLKEDKDRIDLIKACFPGGSITGAPKIRAMEIIEELEPTKRNIYTGSIGYLGFDGSMDLNIAIRTILIKNKTAYFQVGGGIVADSAPEAEFDETLTKARALIDALGMN